MSDNAEWTREDDEHIAMWIARNPNTALASGVRRAVTELWKTQGRLTDLAATVAALTAENERLRKEVQFLRSERPIARRVTQLETTLTDLLDVAPPPIAGRNDYAAARDAAHAALSPKAPA